VRSARPRSDGLERQPDRGLVERERAQPHRVAGERDHADAAALQPLEQRLRLALRLFHARRRHVARLHAGRDVEHERDVGALRLPAHRLAPPLRAGGADGQRRHRREPQPHRAQPPTGQALGEEPRQRPRPEQQAERSLGAQQRPPLDERERHEQHQPQ
jgi:hypothetical protein